MYRPSQMREAEGNPSAAVSVTNASRHDSAPQALQWPFVVNGKFASQRTTGVQRVAAELTAALQRLLAPHVRLPVLVPPVLNADRTPLADETACGRLNGIWWEQLSLPFAVRGRTLISLCNVAPLLLTRQVVMIHDMAVLDIPENYSWKFRLWYRLVFWQLKWSAVRILTVSHFSKARIVDRLGVDPARVAVVHNGVDHLGSIDSDARVLSKHGLAAGQYVLVVGSLSTGKNLARTLAAMRSIGDDVPYKFVVVGGSNARIFGAGTPGTGQAQRNVVMAGFVSDGELKALYENAGCFVFPSLYEGFGLPPLEAMYCGCPVIASREASLPEVCGDAAMYCDAMQVDDIAARIRTMMEQPALREDYRRKGLAQARAFTWDAAARRLLAILRDDLHAGQAGR